MAPSPPPARQRQPAPRAARICAAVNPPVMRLMHFQFKPTPGVGFALLCCPRAPCEYCQELQGFRHNCLQMLVAVSRQWGIVRLGGNPCAALEAGGSSLAATRGGGAPRHSKRRPKASFSNPRRPPPHPTSRSCSGVVCNESVLGTHRNPAGVTRPPFNARLFLYQQVAQNLTRLVLCVLCVVCFSFRVSY